MQQNEFEKQVQKMMDGFNPHPSEAVWKNISRSINTDKRKKRWFVFWLFAILITAGGSILVYRISTEEKPVAGKVAHQKPLSTDSIMQVPQPVQQDPNEQGAQTTANVLQQKNVDAVSINNNKTRFNTTTAQQGLNDHVLSDYVARQKSATNASVDLQDNSSAQQINTGTLRMQTIIQECKTKSLIVSLSLKQIRLTVINFLLTAL